MPEKILNLFTLSSNRRFYERIGVRQVRRFVQNGDVAKGMAGKEKEKVVNNVSQARYYLKTISMYERFHWICFIFFLFTAILCFYKMRIELGFMIFIANLLFNVSSILLQQYNKIRIRNLTG
jgi:glycosyl-4,4'-diaponeurosporenoate acyltransferase